MEIRRRRGASAVSQQARHRHRDASSAMAMAQPERCCDTTSSLIRLAATSMICPPS